MSCCVLNKASGKEDRRQEAAQRRPDQGPVDQSWACWSKIPAIAIPAYASHLGPGSRSMASPRG